MFIQFSLKVSFEGHRNPKRHKNDNKKNFKSSMRFFANVKYTFRYASSQQVLSYEKILWNFQWVQNFIFPY